MAELGFNALGGLLKGIAADTANLDIKMIDISELHDSSENFFEVSEIDALADSILAMGGVQENLIVTPIESGGYEIVSGHRRTAAVRRLLDKGENISSKLPCRLKNYIESDDKTMDLVLMNVTQRRINDKDYLLSFEKIDAMLKEGKKNGEKLGKIRNQIAEMLDISPAQVGNIEYIDKHAVPELKDAVAHGEVSIAVAREVAKLTDEDQREMLETEDLSSLSKRDTKAKVDAKQEEKKSEITELQVIESDEEEPVAELYFEEKVATGSNLSELEKFVYDNRAFILDALDTYTSMVDTEAERKVMLQFISIISKSKF